MVPSTFVTLDAIPLLPNNKANVAALPKPEYAKPLHADLERRYAHPFERELAAIWEEVLETGRFGLEDSFFDVGGHSLLMARLGALIEERLRITISNIDLFQFPTVRSLARHLSQEKAGAPALVSEMARRAALAGGRGRPRPGLREN
jgi:acyl carrier protein